MEFSIKSGSPEKQRTGCVVVGVFEGRKLSASARDIDRATKGFVADVLRRGDHDGKAGTTVLLHCVSGLPSDRVLLVGLGKEREMGESAYRRAIDTAIKALRATGATDAAFYLTDLALRKRDTAFKVEQAVRGLIEGVSRVHRKECHPAGAQRAPPRAAGGACAAGRRARAPPAGAGRRRGSWRAARAPCGRRRA